MKRRNIIKLAIAIIVIIGVSFWVYDRWDAWFKTLPDPAYSTPDTPDRIMLLPGEDFAKDRIVTWRCGTTEQTSYLYLIQNKDTTIIEAEPSLAETRGGTDMYYRSELEDLLNDSIYSYYVSTGNHRSSIYQFKMSSNSGLKRLLYIGDVQDTIGGNSKEILHNIYNENRDVDAIACCGDLLEAPTNEHWDYVFNNLDSISKTLPMICNPGNHEYIKSLPPYLDTRWCRTFAYNENGASLCDATFYIESPNVLFIAMDTHIFKRGITIFTQYNWIKNTIEEKGKGKIKILMMHHPVRSVKKGRSNFIEKHLIGHLIEEYGIDVVLGGHEHGYARHIAKSTKGKSLYIVSHCSPKSYPTEANIPDTKIISDTKMYETLDFEGSKIIYKAYNAETNELLDSLTITK
ncbi:MAG: metallophosphoesterase [Muribaculaceae bacterium]|nr:metallophosphoesterase [Muribaculaceae bacterium]